MPRVRFRPVVPAFALAALLLAPLSAVAGEHQDDLKARRARLMQTLDAGTVFIAWSAPPRVYSTDVNYEYRQDSNLLYLTGLEQEDTILVLMPGASTKKEVIFVREPDPRREHRNGHILSQDEVTAATGVETVMPGLSLPEPSTQWLAGQQLMD